LEVKLPVDPLGIDANFANAADGDGNQAIRVSNVKMQVPVTMRAIDEWAPMSGGRERPCVLRDTGVFCERRANESSSNLMLLFGRTAATAPQIVSLGRAQVGETGAALS
jgi:hypothetical protein